MPFMRYLAPLPSFFDQQDPRMASNYDIIHLVSISQLISHPFIRGLFWWLTAASWQCNGGGLCLPFLKNRLIFSPAFPINMTHLWREVLSLLLWRNNEDNKNEKKGSTPEQNNKKTTTWATNKTRKMVYKWSYPITKYHCNGIRLIFWPSRWHFWAKPSPLWRLGYRHLRIISFFMFERCQEMLQFGADAIKPTWWGVGLSLFLSLLLFWWSRNDIFEPYRPHSLEATSHTSPE